MLHASGLGLAAAQVGAPVAVVTVLRDTEESDVLALINPHVVEAEGEQEAYRGLPEPAHAARACDPARAGGR